jgi:hypothetical protein
VPAARAALADGYQLACIVSYFYRGLESLDTHLVN